VVGLGHSAPADANRPRALKAGLTHADVPAKSGVGTNNLRRRLTASISRLLVRWSQTSRPGVVTDLATGIRHRTAVASSTKLHRVAGHPPRWPGAPCLQLFLTSAITCLGCSGAIA